MAAEFDLPGTRDPTPFLVIAEVLDFRSRLGGEAAIRSYNHRLCWESAQFLARHWDTPFTTPESMIGAMAVIPLPERFGSTVTDAERLRRFLSEERQVEVPIFAVGGDREPDAEPDPYGAGGEPGLVVRICAQIYNDTADIERLAEAVDAA